MSRSVRWGTAPEEPLLAFACDRYVENFDAAYYRGVTIETRPEVIFRWLCQLRVAPYSYDWIDNGGRKSPEKLTPGIDELAIGQRVMTGFRLVDFEYNRQLTIAASKDTPKRENRAESLGSRIFGDIAVTYLIVPRTSDSCRLLVKLVARYPRGIIGWFMRRFLPYGDMIMMRRQLLNFKKLSEQTQESVQLE